MTGRSSSFSPFRLSTTSVETGDDGVSWELLPCFLWSSSGSSNLKSSKSPKYVPGNEGFRQFTRGGLDVIERGTSHISHVSSSWQHN